MRRRIKALAQKPGLVLDFSAVTKVDETGALALQDLVHRLQGEGISAYIAGLQREPLRMLIRMGVVDRLGRSRVCKGLDIAIRRAAQELALNGCAESAPSEYVETALKEDNETAHQPLSEA